MLMDDIEEEVEAKKRPLTENTTEGKRKPKSDASLRVLVTGKEVGCILGKAGGTIVQIRSESQASVLISNRVEGSAERILVIHGPLDCVAKAFSLVSATLQDGLGQVNLQLLIPHQHMGLVIGRHGSTLRNIMAQSNARLSALEDLLPNSTDRILHVSGVPDAIQIAVYHIALVLQSSTRALGYVPYQPMPIRPPDYMISHSVSPHPSTPSSVHRQLPTQEQVIQQLQQQLSHNGVPVLSYSPPAVHQLEVPAELAGAIIGKGGTKISQLRQSSGCRIQISPSHHGPKRTITVTGPADRVQMALFTLYQRLESEKIKQALQ
jgi:heterogeneous nuclear rnp K-like protein 2